MKKSIRILSDGRLSVLIIVAILIIDQIIKIAVKSNMYLGESIHVTDWFYIDFIENSGMAYGMTFVNKLFLSIVRLAAICVIGWYIHKQVKSHARTRYIVLLSMVLAGAAGNMFDSIFYGLFFSASTPYSVATVVPFGEGYAGFLTGKVVDMFYFPLIVTTWPDWVPIWGGQDFIFFSPIFNFADACISVGMVLLLIFCRKDLETISFKKSTSEQRNDTEEK
jgi:signal peptidase II